jgi:hypothetical protein
MLVGIEARRLAATGQSGKLASSIAPVHQGPMRRLAPALTLLVAACATTPPPAPAPAKTAPIRQHGDLIGLTAEELVQRFGRPGFQVREGAGLKLQFAAGGCVLDAYLYPQSGNVGIERVTHVDTRRPSGEDMPQATCLAALTPR